MFEHLDKVEVVHERLSEKIPDDGSQQVQVGPSLVEPLDGPVDPFGPLEPEDSIAGSGS